MNRFLIVLFTLLFSIPVKSQHLEKFKLTADGVNTISIEIDSLTSAELYGKVLGWTNLAYLPKELEFVENTPNELIYVTGLDEEGFFRQLDPVNLHYGSLEYGLKFSFNDGRIDFSFLILQCYMDTWEVSTSSFFKDSGEVRKNNKSEVWSLEKFMNDIATSLNNHLKIVAE